MSRELRVLLVEDVEHDAELLLRELDRGGFVVTSERVETAAGLTDALARGVWDVVVSDYMMPGQTGLDIAREVAAVRADLPVIIFSGHIDEDLRRKARELGVRQLLGKLDAPDELTEAIDRLTSNAEAH